MRLHHERIPFAGWVWLLLAALVVFSLYGLTGLRGPVGVEAPGVLWFWDGSWILTLAIAVGIPLFFGRLEVALDEAQLTLRFGYLPLVTRRIPVAQIRSARAVDYRPIAQFGGWGIRRGRYDGAMTAVYSMRGSRGVLLELADPISAALSRVDRVLVGCEEPELLAERLRTAARA